MAADPIIYCLEHLTDYSQFERLCHDLMASEGYASIEPLGGMKDKGRDALHANYHRADEVTIFAYSVREDWRKKLEEDCKKIHDHKHVCHRLVFLCTADFSASERDEAVSFVSDTFGWELVLYGLERLRVLLGTVHPFLIGNHPQIFCPPFFPQAGGLTIVRSADCLVIDYSDSDESLAAWLFRRLTIEGYKVWCRSMAPIGGSSLHETLDTLIRYRAFRVIAILSPASIANPDMTSRRSLALSVSPELLIPIVASKIDTAALDSKTRTKELIAFEKDWAKGLAQLLDVLVAVDCPRSSTGGSGIALRTFMPPEVISSEPEILYSNRFPVSSIPAALLRFTAIQPMDIEASKRL